MNRASRLLVSAGILGMAAASNAAIIISGIGSDGYTTGTGTAVINKSSLADFSTFVGTSNVTISGSFFVKSTFASIIQVDAQVKTNGVSLGYLDVNADVATTPVLGSFVTEGAGNENALSTTNVTTAVSLLPSINHLVNWSFKFSGKDPNAYAYVNQAVFIFKEDGTTPVPEPASMAVIATGVFGMMARRRKGGK